MPAHLYQGSDPLKNPHNIAPIGTSPFRFLTWCRGEFIELARNENCWDQSKPYLDKPIFRLMPDDASRAAAFETREVKYGPFDPVSLADIARLKKNPAL
ncbi:MAG: ABC transporter substrate-binding protein [Candidatus Malihini olakiniferum]